MDTNILNESFLRAIEIVNNFKIRPSDNELLKLYGLFKQANEGDNNSPEPGFLDIKNKRKWTSWRCNMGIPQDIAKSEYINYVMDCYRELIDDFDCKKFGMSISTLLG